MKFYGEYFSVFTSKCEIDDNPITTRDANQKTDPNSEEPLLFRLLEGDLSSGDAGQLFFKKFLLVYLITETRRSFIASHNDGCLMN